MDNPLPQHLQSLLDGEFNWQLMLVSGTNAQGLSIYAMVAVQEKNIEKFFAAQQQAGFEAEDHGTVLLKGFGVEPPPFSKFEATQKFESGEWA